MSSQGGTGVGQSNRMPALPSTPATASSPAGQLAADSFSTSTGFGVSSAGGALASSGANASAEARQRVALITAQAGLARRSAEAAWARRFRLLQLRLVVVGLEQELDDIVSWFLNVCLRQHNLVTIFYFYFINSHY
ncbi:unnamed protein product [Protopolystoma xenopodis]|uniref:Uncharacterized protein n=1 Tax=Protopolystoma xenopodis TaxID=117903 RepID=A0A448XN09_9PLAT|nr:unnamed protein product [Protopolystoma xenopodis]